MIDIARIEHLPYLEPCFFSFLVTIFFNSQYKKKSIKSITLDESKPFIRPGNKADLTNRWRLSRF